MALSTVKSRRENKFLESSAGAMEGPSLIYLSFARKINTASQKRYWSCCKVVLLYPTYLKSLEILNIDVKVGEGNSCHVCMPSLHLMLGNILMMISDAREDLSTDRSFIGNWCKSTTV